MQTRLVVSMLILSVLVSGCFFEIPEPRDTTVRLSASPTDASLGEDVTFSIDPSALEGDATVRIEPEGALATLLEPGPVTSLHVLGRIDGRIDVLDDDTATLSFDAQRIGTILDSPTIREIEETLMLATNGRVIEAGIDEPTGTLTVRDVRETSAGYDGLSSATFRIEPVEGTDASGTPDRVTLEPGSIETLSLSGQSADMEITDFNIVDGELASISVKVTPEGSLALLFTRTLTFTFETGQRIRLGSDEVFDVFLEDVSYTSSGATVRTALIEVDGENDRLGVGSIASIGGLPITVGSLSTNAATLIVGDELIRIPKDGTIRYANVTSDYELTSVTGTYVATASAYRVSITDSNGADTLFDTYRLESNDGFTVSDTRSFEYVSSDETSRTMRFKLPGEYTVRASVYDGEELIGESSVTIEVS